MAAAEQVAPEEQVEAKKILKAPPLAEMLKKAGFDESYFKKWPAMGEDLQSKVIGIIRQNKDDLEIRAGVGEWLLDKLKMEKASLEKMGKTEARERRIDNIEDSIERVSAQLDSLKKQIEQRNYREGIQRQAEEIVRPTPKQIGDIAERYGELLFDNKKTSEEFLKDVRTYMSIVGEALDFGVVDQKYLDAIEEYGTELLKGEARKKYGRIIRENNADEDKFMEDAMKLAKTGEIPDKEKVTKEYIVALDKFAARLSGKTPALAERVEEEEKEGPAIISTEALDKFEQRRRGAAKVEAEAAPTQEYVYNVGIGGVAYRITSQKELSTLTESAIENALTEMRRTDLQSRDKVILTLRKYGITEVLDEKGKDAVLAFADALRYRDPLERSEWIRLEG